MVYVLHTNLIAITEIGSLEYLVLIKGRSMGVGLGL